MFELIEKIRINLQSPLPGADAQYQMAPDERRIYADQIKNYKAAAVLSLLYPKRDEWHMVFIQRTSHKNDKHSAQIAFPGGKVEDADANYIDAALREANEEIGTDPSNIHILGELTPLKIPVSRFEVYPVFAFTENEPIFNRQVSEVEKIIEVPVNTIVNPNNRAKKEIKLPSGLVLQDVPIFNFDNHIVWGATSMMLNEIIEILT